MSEMVERVARAICEAHGFRSKTGLTADPDFIWSVFNKDSMLAEARAAIAAMREPTRPMVRATFHNEAFVTNWQSAIDEALK